MACDNDASNDAADDEENEAEADDADADADDDDDDDNAAAVADAEDNAAMSLLLDKFSITDDN